MTVPQLTIALINYNGESNLRDCLDSILAQTFTDFKLIVSDNASTDGSADIIKEYAARDERVVYWPTSYNISMYFNWLRLFLGINTEFYVNMHVDHRYAPTYLEECLRVLKADKSAVLAYSQCQFIDKSGSYIDLYRDTGNFADPDPGQRYLNVLTDLGWNTPWNGVRRHAASLKCYQATYRNYNAAFDNLFLALFALMGKLVQVEKPLFFRIKDKHQQQGDSMPMLYARRYSSTDIPLPFFNFIRDHCLFLTLFDFDVPMERTNELLRQTVSILTARYSRHLSYELKRIVDMVGRGDFKSRHGHSETDRALLKLEGVQLPSDESSQCEVNAEAPLGKYVSVDFVYLAQLSADLDYARNIMPDFQGLNYARALVYIWLGRRIEALGMLEDELRLNPIDRKTLDLKAKLVALQK